MGLVRGRPLGNGPKAIHQTPWAVGEFVGEPPLVAVRRVGFAGQTLKIRYPIERAKSFFFVGFIPCLCEIQGFDSSEPCGVAIAALIWLVAAETRTIALFGSNGGSVDAILRPLGSRLYPLDELVGVLSPVGIFFGMQQNVARKLQRNDIVHVVDVRWNIFEVAGPD